MSRSPQIPSNDPGLLVAEVGGGTTVAEIGQRLTRIVAERLGVPAALLSHLRGRWRFEAEALPARPGGAAPWSDAAPSDLAARAETRWTGVVLGGERQGRTWVLLLPGVREVWDGSPLVQQLAASIGALLEDAAEREEIGEWRRFAMRLHRFGRALQQARSSAELHALIVRSMAAAIDARVGSLALYSHSDRALAVVATTGYPNELVEHVRIAPGEGIIGEVFRSGRGALGQVGEERPRRLRYRTDSYVALPLRRGNDVLGVLVFTDRCDGAPFTGRDLAVLRMLADPAVLALAADEERRTAEEVRRIASIDPLTGLLNRRYFDARLEAELQRARRRNEPLALLMVDIDNFKAINDEFGHITGDRVLRCVADCLRRCLRAFDVCARYGGDEFAIVMPSSTRESALLVADRIRSSVLTNCTTGPELTLSIGIALSNGRERDLLPLADRALLEAKAVGKNAVRVSG